MSTRLAAIFFLILTGAFAQQQQRTFRATITGGNGNGKCTIEVDVDDVAVVQISGDQGRLITLSGQPAEWRRFTCNQVMPPSPGEFRFKGIDGRGRVGLTSDPRQNRGVAEIRIEDSKGGREGYTFDLEWNGTEQFNSGNQRGNGGFGNGGFGNGNNGNGNGNGGFGNGNGRGNNGSNAFVVSCASNNNSRNYCGVDTANGVRMLRQQSQAPCREGSTWGYDRRGIWVDRGCKAEFQVGR